MTEPQAWTLIGVFAAIMLGGMTLSTTLLMQSMKAAIGGLGARIEGVETGLTARIGGVETGLTARIEAVETGLRAEISGLRAEMNARFDTVDTKIEHLDRDVTALTRRAWDEPSPD